MHSMVQHGGVQFYGQEDQGGGLSHGHREVTSCMLWFNKEGCSSMGRRIREEDGLVGQMVVCKPKCFGNLGVKNLECIAVSQEMTVHL